MPAQCRKLRESGTWLVGHWRAALIVFVLAPVLGPGIALFCLAGGVRAVVRSRSAEVAKQISLGETLEALVAAVLPLVVYGCAAWGLQAVIQPSDWVGWFIMTLVAGLVGLVAGLMPAFYIVGYSWRVAKSEASPTRSRASGPRMSLSDQMLRPFRRTPP